MFRLKFNIIPNFFIAFLLISIYFQESKAQIITTIAGTGVAGNTGIGGPAIDAQLNNPAGIAIDKYNNIYIADANNNRIKKIDASGNISIIAGTGSVPATLGLCHPTGVTVDDDGNVYFLNGIYCSGQSNNVYKINTAGVVSVLTWFNYLNAQPVAITVDKQKNVYIANWISNQVVKVTPTGTESVVATSSQVFYPGGVAVDSKGNIYIADHGNFEVKKVNTSGVVSTFSSQYRPNGVAVDAQDNVYITTHDEVVVKITPAGVHTIVAGTGTEGYSGDGGLALNAKLNLVNTSYNQGYFSGMAFDSDGNLYFSDKANNRVRKVTANAPCSIPAPPVATTPSVNLSICMNNTTTLSASSSVGTINWYNTAEGGKSLGTGPTFVTPVLTQTTTFYAAVSDNICSSIRVPIVVTVNASANIVSSSNAALCDYGTAVLSVTGAGTFNWYDTPTDAVSISTGESYTTPVLYASRTYYVEATGGSCKSARQPVSVTITNTPSISLSSNVNSPVCYTGSATLSAVVSGNATVKWYSTFTGTTALATGLTYTTPSVTATTTYYAEASLNGCTSTRKSIDLPIIDKPKLDLALVYPANACMSAAPNNFTITVKSSEIGVTYQIMDHSTPIGTQQTGTGSDLDFNLTKSLGHSSNYFWVDATRTGSGCPAVTLNKTVGISAFLDPQDYLTDIVGNATPCIGTTTTYTVFSTPFADFAWTLQKDGVILKQLGSLSSATNKWDTPGEYDLVIIPSNYCGVGPGKKLKVTVNENISSLPTVSNVAYCLNATASPLTATGDKLLWYTAATGGTGSNTAPTPVTTAAGTLSYYVTQNPAGCEGPRAKIDVLTRALPVLTITSNLVNNGICINNPVTLTAGGADTYIWTGGISNGTPFTPASTTSYTVTGTDVYGCVNTKTQAVTVNPLPTISIVTVPANGIACEGSQVKLTASGAKTYSWTGGISNGVNFNASGTTTSYIVTATDANGCINTKTQVLTVNPAPVLTITSVPANGAICKEDFATLTASGAKTYSWTGGIFNGAQFYPNATASYTVTGTGTNGCIASLSKTITVNPLPTINISSVPGSTVCVGDELTLTASGATTYSWSDGISNGEPFKPNFPTYPPMDVNYTVTGTDANGCSNTKYQVITGRPLPDMYIFPNPFSGVVCQGASATINVYGAATYTFSGGISNGVPFKPTTTTSYTITGIDSYGCKATQTQIITVPTIAITTVPENGIVCNGEEVTFTASGASTYTWSGGISNGIPFNPTSTASYTVTAKDANNCTMTKTQNITVNPLPTITVSTIPESATLCAGEEAILTANGAVSYSWSDGINDGIPFIPTSTQSYTVKGKGANGCENSSTQVITVNPLPTITISTSPEGATICEGEEVVLTANGGVYYSWSDAINDGMPFKPTSTKTYFVKGKDVNGCESFTSQAITVNPLPIITITTNPESGLLCKGEDAVLTASGAVSYSWTDGIENGIAFTPTLEMVYTVTGTDINSCSNTAQITLNEKTDCEATSIENNVAQNLLIYPNPIIDYFTIENDKMIDLVEIYDVNGMLVYTQKINAKKETIKPLLTSAGIYTIKLYTNSKVSISKLVKY